MTDLYLGKHVLVDMWNCEASLDDVDFIKDIMTGAAEDAGATICEVSSHKFEPQGVSAMVIIAESHFSAHTWPEHNFVALDFFTCGKVIDIETAIGNACRALMPSEVKTRFERRGEGLPGM